MIPVLVTHKFKLTQLVNASKKMQTIEIFYTILLGIVHTFFTRKMILKYSLRTIHVR